MLLFLFGKARNDIDTKCYNKCIQYKSEQAVNQRQSPDFLVAYFYVRYLESATYYERKIGKVDIIGPLITRKFQPAFRVSAVIHSCIVKCKNGVHDRP